MNDMNQKHQPSKLAHGHLPPTDPMPQTSLDLGTLSPEEERLQAMLTLLTVQLRTTQSEQQGRKGCPVDACGSRAQRCVHGSTACSRNKGINS